MNILTLKQAVVLIALQNFLKEHSYCPSIKDLCALTGLKSTSTIHFHLSQLEKKGYISYPKGVKRVIRVLKNVEPYWYEVVTR